MTPTQALLSAMERDLGGVAVVLCPDLGLQAWLVDEVHGLAPPDAEPFRTSSVDEAISSPHRMVLLVPDDERAAVDELEGRRDQLLEPPRTQPVVLFLIRGGDGQVELAKSPSLSSWVRGSDVDPEELADVDVIVERARFETEVGETVERWLGRWRAHEIERNGEMFARAYRAALLERT